MLNPLLQIIEIISINGHEIMKQLVVSPVDLFFIQVKIMLATVALCINKGRRLGAKVSKGVQFFLFFLYLVFISVMNN